MPFHLAAALALLAAAPPPWEAAPPFSADPVAMVREAAALPPPRDADVDVLAEEFAVAFDEEGRAAVTSRLVFRPLTREAAARWAEVRRAWAPWHQARPELRARVIAPDGTVHVLDPATIVEGALGPDEQPVYSDRRVLKAPLPAVDAGAVVEEEATVRETAPLFPAGAVRRFFVGRDGPVRLVRLRVEAPRALPLAWRARGGLDGAPGEAVEGGRRVLSWAWRDVPPQARPEPLSPPDGLVPAHVAVSTGRSWGEVASAYAAVVDGQLAGQALAAAAEEAVPRGADRVAAAQAVLDWLRARVRYTGLELGESALVPTPPREVLRRRFGDCKDLALLAAGLLREAGHEATLALVRSVGDDPADLPGLGEFDHALVAVAGEPPLFVDASDAFTPAGELAANLQERMALVARRGVTGLTRLPGPAPGRDRADVTREILLPESGWSDAREVRELHGWLATSLRAQRRGLSAREAEGADQELLRAHFSDAAGGEVSWSGLDGTSGPVGVALSAKGSHWGITRADDAEAVVSPGFLLGWLPRAVRPAGEPADAAEEGTDRAGDGPGDGGARRSDLLLPVAWQGTLRYRVVPPAGFTVEPPLPDEVRTQLGPLVHQQRASLEPDGAVLVVHEVAVGRRRLAAEEVDALRAGLGPLLRDEPRVRFVRTSNRLLDEGRGREALDEIRRLVALHPAEARHWNHLAQALLRLGMGEAARAAARRSTELEPSSGWSHRVLATALEHDALGRWLAPGCDLAGAVDAQRRAAELDRDPAVRAHLAFLLEHGEACQRWGEGARLDEAAAVYRSIRAEARTPEQGRALLAVLLRAGRFAEALPVARELPDGPERKAALLAVRAATEGTEAAGREALRIPADERAPILDAASQHLVLVRRYADAARLLEAGAGGTPQSAQLRSRAAVLAKVRRVESMRLDEQDPSTLLLRLFRALAEGGDAWRAVPEAEGGTGEPEVARAVGAAFRRGLRASTGLPPPVALDAGLSMLETRMEGDPSSGLRVVGTMPALSSPLAFVVVREQGRWRLVAAEPVFAELGARARRLAEAGQLAAARNLLRLARAEAGEPEEGRPAEVLAALLPDGREAPAGVLRLAAAALESWIAPDGPRRILEEARAGASDPAVRRALAWALAAGHARAGRWAELLPIAEELLAEAPASARAFGLQGSALLELSRREELEAAVARRLEIAPDDPAAFQLLVSRAIRAGDAADALAQERRLVATGRAGAGDLNNLAWALLFAEPLAPEALELARRAVEMTREREASSLHTLATVHAVRGEPAEALQVLRKAVAQGRNDDRPDDEDWLVVGLIAEQYGLLEEAVAAWRRVRPPPVDDGLSSHRLATRRLAAVGRAADGAGTGGPSR